MVISYHYSHKHAHIVASIANCSLCCVFVVITTSLKVYVSGRGVDEKSEGVSEVPVRLLDCHSWAKAERRTPDRSFKRSIVYVKATLWCMRELSGWVH